MRIISIGTVFGRHLIYLLGIWSSPVGSEAPAENDAGPRPPQDFPHNGEC